MKLLKKGDRIRLKVRLITGWKGVGTVINDQLSENDSVKFKRDGFDDFLGCLAGRHEVALIRKPKTSKDTCKVKPGR